MDLLNFKKYAPPYLAGSQLKGLLYELLSILPVFKFGAISANKYIQTGIWDTSLKNKKWALKVYVSFKFYFLSFIVKDSLFFWFEKYYN